MPLEILAGPASEIVTLDEAKLHCRIDCADDDALVTSLIVAARQLCEAPVARSFINTQWRLTLESFPGQMKLVYLSGDGRLLERPPLSTLDPIVLPRAPVVSIDAITYLDGVGTRQTLATTEYTYELGDGCVIAPAYGKTWPTCRVTIGSVRVDFTAGHGASASTVPATAKAAVKLAVGHLYNNREGEAELPETILQVLGPLDWGYTP